jgi:circadian clock protein KaiC
VEFSPLARIVHEPIAYGTTWLVTGEPGTGKTTLAFQFAVQGLRRGEAAIFVACDEPPGRIENNLRSFGFGTSAYEREQKFILVDAFSRNPQSAFHISDRTDVAEFTYVIARAVETTGRPCRIIVDSLTSIAVNTDPREFLTLVYEKNRALRHDGHVLLDLYLTQKGEEGNWYTVTNAYDVLIDLYLGEERGGVPKRSLRLRKLRGGTYDPRPFPFTIRPQQGVVVNTHYYEE